MKVRPIGSNQTEIETSRGDTVLVSYETPVAAHVNGTYVKTEQRYSATTNKHVNAWLRNNGARQVTIVKQSTLDNLLS